MARDSSDRDSEETTNDAPTEKFRKERRKDGRKAKKQKKLQSWLQYQNAKKKKKTVIEPQQPYPPELPKKRKKDTEPVPPADSKPKASFEVRGEMKACDKKKEEKTKKKSRKKTKFEEFMDMEMNMVGSSDQFDLEAEKKLAKKLKVKRGKLGGFDDGLDMLLEGIPSALDEDVGFGEKSRFEEDRKNVSSTKKRKRMKPSSPAENDQIETREFGAPDGVSTQQPIIHEEPMAKRTAGDGTTKYVAPHLRSSPGNESEEISQMRRRVRGLLNRLSESNIESITHEIAGMYQSMGRSISSQVISEEVLSSCSGGLRGNEQYAAVFAAFVAGMACSVGVDFGGKLIASLARSFEEEYQKEDGLSLRNLTLLLSYLYIFGACGSDLIYDFLLVLTKRLTELDVSTILTVLQCCGMKLRAGDPSAMMQFIVGIQSRVNELDAAAASGKGKRMEFMLETICDIKNNKKKAREDPAHHIRIKKWLQKLRADDVLLRNLTWGKLLDPEKKGQWWLAGESTSTAADDIREVATATDQQAPEAQRLVQLAAAQRMNTDVRRAIFCIIMSGEDYIDAFEKILRLDLSGKQDREIMRVLVECCLQEKVFNRYYAVLATKFCAHDKNHKFTLQYCLWDHYKELEGMELGRSLNLARFTAEMLTSFALPLAALKAVDLGGAMAARKVMHFRMMFEALLAAADAVVWTVFTRVAGPPELEVLRGGLEFFISRHVVGDAASRARFDLARKALRNVAGVLM